MEEVKSWLLETVKLLVDNPAYVRIENKTDEMGVLFTIFVGNFEGKLEAGKIIGKQGKTINALRDVVMPMGAKRSAKFSLRVDAPKFDRPRDKDQYGV